MNDSCTRYDLWSNNQVKIVVICWVYAGPFVASFIIYGLQAYFNIILMRFDMVILYIAILIQLMCFLHGTAVINYNW